MKNRILQHVREARASVAADFNYDLHQFFAWAKRHTASEEKAKHWLPIEPNKALETTGRAGTSSVNRKRRVRPSGV